MVVCPRMIRDIRASLAFFHVSFVRFLVIRALPVSQTNVVYQINCSDCSWSYVGETGRALITRKKEHERNVKKCKTGSNIANHALANDHIIDFKNRKIIDKGSYRHRSTLESWHTACTKDADNNSKHLPEQYRFLLKKL